MAKCVKCEKDFHCCSNCGVSYDWEYDYCSNNCWYSSELYAEKKKEYDDLISSLDKEQKRSVLRLIDGDLFWTEYIAAELEGHYD